MIIMTLRSTPLCPDLESCFSMANWLAESKKK